MFTIFWMKIKLEWHSIIFCSFGALFGMVFGKLFVTTQTQCQSHVANSIQGLEVIDDLLTPPVKKLGFVCIWFSFAFALFLLNRFVFIHYQRQSVH